MRLSAARQLAVVRERLTFLNSLSYDEVAALPKVTMEKIVVDGNRLEVSVWHETLEMGAHLVAVQAYGYWFLGIGRMAAEGFVLSPRNERRPLTLEEWAPFS